MTTKTEVQEGPEIESSLLSSEERASFSQIATKEPPYSQRAQALLAIDGGATQVEAGSQAGLTEGQVRYWLTKFRRDRMNIFPEELLDQPQKVEAGSPRSSAKQTTSPEVPDLAQSQDEEDVQQELLVAEEAAGPVDEATAQQEGTPEAKEKSKKKSKKAKKSGKTKKTKKGKKGKKGKESKKKTKKNKSKKGKDGKSGSGKKKRKK